MPQIVTGRSLVPGILSLPTRTRAPVLSRISRIWTPPAAVGSQARGSSEAARGHGGHQKRMSRASEGHEQGIRRPPPLQAVGTTVPHARATRLGSQRCERLSSVITSGGGRWPFIGFRGLAALRGIPGHPRKPSEAVRGLWKAMEGHGRASKGTEGHGRAWKGTEGHRRPSRVSIKRHAAPPAPAPSVLIRGHRKQSEAIRSHQEPPALAPSCVAAA